MQLQLPLVKNYIHSIANEERTEPTTNSIETFITDRYWGYTKINKNKTAEFKVEHPQRNIHTLKSLNCSATAMKYMENNCIVCFQRNLYAPLWMMAHL